MDETRPSPFFALFRFHVLYWMQTEEQKRGGLGTRQVECSFCLMACVVPCLYWVITSLMCFQYRSLWWRSTALPLRCGSWVHVTCANWPGTLYWWADLSTMYVCRLVYLSTNMLVLGRNQIFTFCCIFQLRCHIQNTVVLNFCWGSGSYMLHMSLCSMREPHPPLTEVLCYSGLNAETILKYIHSSSIYTWPYHICTKITKRQSI